MKGRRVVGVFSKSPGPRGLMTWRAFSVNQNRGFVAKQKKPIRIPKGEKCFFRSRNTWGPRVWFGGVLGVMGGDGYQGKKCVVRWAQTLRGYNARGFEKKIKKPELPQTRKTPKKGDHQGPRGAIKLLPKGRGESETYP